MGCCVSSPADEVPKPVTDVQAEEVKAAKAAEAAHINAMIANKPSQVKKEKTFRRKFENARTGGTPKAERTRHRVRRAAGDGTLDEDDLKAVNGALAAEKAEAAKLAGGPISAIRAMTRRAPRAEGGLPAGSKWNLLASFSKSTYSMARAMTRRPAPMKKGATGARRLDDHAKWADLHNHDEDDRDSTAHDAAVVAAVAAAKGDESTAKKKSAKFALADEETVKPDAGHGFTEC